MLMNPALVGPPGWGARWGRELRNSTPVLRKEYRGPIYGCGPECVRRGMPHLEQSGSSVPRESGGIPLEGL